MKEPVVLPQKQRTTSFVGRRTATVVTGPAPVTTKPDDEPEPEPDNDSPPEQ